MDALLSKPLANCSSRANSSHANDGRIGLKREGRGKIPVMDFSPPLVTDDYFSANSFMDARALSKVARRLPTSASLAA